jgi:NADH:ubiquinone oxidoreductase subunit H
MENKKLSALALIVVGLGAVNFLYLADLLVPRETTTQGIILGWKSAIAIAVANLIALYGAWRIARVNNGD